MNNTTRERFVSSCNIQHALIVLNISFAVSFLLIFLFIALSRISYPFELEWMEGGSLLEMQRILAGERIYVPPSIQFTPYIYPPVYFYLSSIVGALLQNDGFIPLRLVSTLASIGSILLIYGIIYQNSGGKFAGIVGCGLFAASYQLCGFWFDIGRVDSLFLFFLLAGIFTMIFNTKGLNFLSGLCFFLSFMTKQTALFAILLILGFQILSKKKNALLLTLTTFSAIGISYFLLKSFTNNWYQFYVFYLPSLHRIQFYPFWTMDIIPNFFIALIIILTSIAPYRLTEKDRSLDEIAISAISLILISWAGRLNPGGYNNVLMPAAAGFSILVGLSWTIIKKYDLSAFFNFNMNTESIFLAGCVIQFALLVYTPFDQIPNHEDLQANQEFVETIQDIDGNSLIPFHPYLCTYAGKTPNAHIISLWEFIGVYGDKEPQFGAQLQEQINTSIRDGQFSTLVLDTSGPQLVDQTQLGEYFTKYPAFPPGPAGFPVTGAQVKPDSIYLLQ